MPLWHIKGADRKTGKDHNASVSADTEKDALLAAKELGILVESMALAPTPVARLLGPEPESGVPQPSSRQRFTYKMVQVPPTIEAKAGEKNHAATYLEGVVNIYAAQGWEFFRVDTIGVQYPPGCLGLLLGHPPETIMYYVITFRSPVA